MDSTNLALLYSDAEGKMKRIADIEVSAHKITIIAYGYNHQRVGDLVPQVVDNTPFWKDTKLYRRALVHTYGTKGLDFEEGTVYFRLGTAAIKPTEPVSGKVTKYPPQEMPENWSTRIPTPGQIGYRNRRRFDHET